MTSTTKKNTHKCTQDIRSIPPARCALPTDGRKVASLCKDRKALLMLISSWANGDGTSIKVSVPELARAQGCSPRTIKYRLKELRTLGFLHDGEIDGYFHTRVRAIDIGRVQDSPETPVQDSKTRVQDSPEKGAGFEEKGAGLTGKGAGLTIQSALPSYDRPKTVPLTVAPSEKSGGSFLSVVSGSDSKSHDNQDQTHPERKPTIDSEYANSTALGKIQKASAMIAVEMRRDPIPCSVEGCLETIDHSNGDQMDAGRCYLHLYSGNPVNPTTKDDKPNALTKTLVKPPDAIRGEVRMYHVKGVGRVAGTSYEDAERKVRAQRDAYLERKGAA